MTKTLLTLDFFAHLSKHALQYFHVQSAWLGGGEWKIQGSSLPAFIDNLLVASSHSNISGASLGCNKTMVNKARVVKNRDCPPQRGVEKTEGSTVVEREYLAGHPV